jgi:hypothetical protein
MIVNIASRMRILASFLALCSTERNAVQAEWQKHVIRQGDGQGGWVARPAELQVLKYPESVNTLPFGLIQMDNGEIAILCSREVEPPKGRVTIEPIIAFSKDGGANWTDFKIIASNSGRPMILTDHGKGRLSFVTEHKVSLRLFSSDYGRTWPERIANPPAKGGTTFQSEGNSWVDRDDQGRATAILQLGHHYSQGKSHPKDDSTGVFRRSVDGAKTWIDEVAPPQWKFTVEHNGKKWLRGVHEGAIARAANGDLVAVLRTGEPPQYFTPGDPSFVFTAPDNMCGTASSISRDDGKTWTELQILFQAGRHHANLQRLPNGSLVCTLIVRNDIQDGRQVSDRRGCDALISHDNGKTWNLDRRYELDGFDYEATAADRRADGSVNPVKCGHIGAVALPDGHVISAYGNYQLGASVLIKWRPDATPAASR